jgi:hypothetical protein
MPAAAISYDPVVYPMSPEALTSAFPGVQLKDTPGVAIIFM